MGDPVVVGKAVRHIRSRFCGNGFERRNGRRRSGTYRTQQFAQVPHNAYSVLRADWDQAVGDESTPATRWWRHAPSCSNDTSTTSTQRLGFTRTTRPSCPARTPKRENVAFFATTAEALRAGYRPCKRCKPDQPPLAERQAAQVAALWD